MKNEQIENAFKYHSPKNDNQIEKYKVLRNEMKKIAFLIDGLVPDSREKSVALTKLEECNMWANAGIARNE